MRKTKYILVDRGSEYSLIATTVEVLNDWDNCIYCAPIVSQRPITMSEIRKRNILVYTLEAHKIYAGLPFHYDEQGNAIIPLFS